jgi:hypothetical protein
MKNIHILPTDKPSRLFVDIDDNKLKITQTLSGEYMMNQNIYITSDEEIKDVRPHKGKWQLEQEQILNKFPTYLTDLSECKLVIITTDQELIKDGVQAIDDTFLEWFVKNPNCEKIEIKTRYLHSYKTGETFISFSKTPEFSSRNMQCVKIEPRYEIIIPQEEPKKMSKQTSVDFLIEEFSAIFGKVNFTAMQGLLLKDAVERAKEMEKEQQEMAFNEALDQLSDRSFEKYYNETYKKEEK